MVGYWDKVANLFGVGHHDETDSYSIKHQQGWEERRKRLLNRRCGHLSKGHRCEEPFDVPEQPDEQRQKHRRARQQGQSSPTQARIPRDVGWAIRIKNGKRAFGDDVEDGPLDTPITHGVAQKSRPLTASFIASRSGEHLNRTNSDTALDQQKNLDDEENVSTASFDVTDFDARENITKLVNDVLARHEPKRAFGIGFVGKLLSRKFRKDLTYSQLSAVYSFNDHRPYFTYWVTTVQILIMFITLITYGFGPFGLSKSLIKDTVYVSDLSYHKESYYEKDNFWLGPRSLDLIHLGAKFTPCMRRDSLIFDEIIRDREEEKSTGCCIRNDQSGCLQTSKDACSPLSKWFSWNETSSEFVSYSELDKRRRLSGPVCGQDPRYCLVPASTDAHAWPDDITQWPICRQSSQTIQPLHHMSCEVVGRPCCIGIYGQCRIVSSQHCQFLHGTFHPEATLCSQVSCMEDVCGMVPFYARDYPDQFYRLFTAIFLHAGLIHLSFTVVLQCYIMRDIERLLGSTRMAIIYILPGIAGYLASATFVPYHTQVGPSGGQFALLACLMAETINSWRVLEDPMNSLSKLILIAMGLFFVGLLPWIDNYAHIFGFIVGLLLSLALTPYLTPFNDAYSRRQKVIQIWVCLSLVLLIFVLLPIPLYVFPLYKCSWCQYLDCWPLTPTWCENQDIKVARLDKF